MIASSSLPASSSACARWRSPPPASWIDRTSPMLAPLCSTTLRLCDYVSGDRALPAPAPIVDRREQRLLARLVVMRGVPYGPQHLRDHAVRRTAAPAIREERDVEITRER